MSDEPSNPSVSSQIWSLNVTVTGELGVYFTDGAALFPWPVPVGVISQRLQHPSREPVSREPESRLVRCGCRWLILRSACP